MNTHYLSFLSAFFICEITKTELSASITRGSTAAETERHISVIDTFVSRYSLLCEVSFSR